MNPLKAKLRALSELDEDQVQDFLARDLRQAAINHLKKGQGVVARGFRSEYLASQLGDFQDFLTTQARDGTWGTDIEAAALGEKLGCHIMVTPVKQDFEQEPFCLYRAPDKNAPVVHLYNRDNCHWYSKSVAHTKGNGNCLYNAFAQELRRIAVSQPQFVHSKNVSLNTTVTTKRDAPKNSVAILSSAAQKEVAVSQKQKGLPKVQRFFADNLVVTDHSELYKTQQSILETIQKCATPAELQVMQDKEQVRISKLSLKEQQQIADDHQLALALARNEMKFRR